MSDDLIILGISLTEAVLFIIMIILNIKTFGFLKVKHLFIPVSASKLYSILYNNDQVVSIERYNKFVSRFLLISIVFLFAIIVTLASEN